MIRFASRRWLLLWVVLGVVSATLVGFLAVRIVPSIVGRTPPSGFLKEVFGDDALVFDKTYSGGGSSEDRIRIVIVETDQTPQEALREISDGGGWAPVGQGIERGSDGLCVIARSAADYLASNPRQEAAQEVSERGPKVLVLSLLYC